jgi:hypothetical protein
MKTGKLVSIENKHVRFSFDAETGRIVSMKNKKSDNDYLQDPEKARNVFCIYHGFIREFEVSAPGGGTPCFADNPAEITKQMITPGLDTAATFASRKTKTGQSLAVAYKDAGSNILVKLTVSLLNDAEFCNWKLTLVNNGDEPAELMPVFPLLSGFRLGDGKRNLMVVNDQAGYILPLWSATGGIYGNAKYMSMQWGCVFDEGSGDAFGFVVKDPDIRSKAIWYHKPSIEVSFFPPISLNPGETHTLPEAQIHVYTGDWKKTAVAYSEWFSKKLPAKKQAAWVKNIDAHGSGWFSVQTAYGPEPSFSYTMESFRDVIIPYRRVPMDNYEFAFHCSRSMPREVTGKTALWTDGDNVLRKDLGGARALREGLKTVHDSGHHFTFYVEGYLCPGDADIVTIGKAGDWAVMNRDGTNQGSYTKQGIEQGGGLLHMCPGAKGWQNHLARTAARLVRQTDADGVRLDSLGFYFFPCYNPKHKHKNPFDYNIWVRELLDRVAVAVQKINPDCLLTTEGGPDFFAPHFDGSLTQHWLDKKIAVTRDVSPMRVAVPDYAIVAHGPCGPVAASLMGYPGGIGGSGTPDRMVNLDLRWRACRHSAADVIRWGDAAHDNPEASRADVECRRFTSKEIEVIVGARSLYSDEWKKENSRIGVIMNSNIDIKKGKVSYSVTFNSRNNTPRYAVLYDIEKTQMDIIKLEVSKGVATFETTANWFMAILAYNGAPPLAYMTGPENATAGEEIELNFALVGATTDKKIGGKLVAPAFGISTPKTVQVPGIIIVQIPVELAPGNYAVQLDSGSFTGCRRYINVGR